jgi:hypothetical protein
MSLTSSRSNTYTNKTWSEVSGVSLGDITKAESEFLRGLGYSLYIDKERFEVWERALKGFVLAQERARREHERSRASRNTFSYGLPSLHSPSSRDGRPARRSVSSFPRARSTSPHRARLPALYIPPSTAAPAPTYAYNYVAADHEPMSIDSAAANAGAKRSAADAFSPSASPCDWRPTKRPTSMHLEIPPVALQQRSPPGSASTSIETANSPMKTSGTYTVPRTLVAPYCMNSTNQPVAPQVRVRVVLRSPDADVTAESLLLRPLRISVRPLGHRRRVLFVSEGPSPVSPTFNARRRSCAILSGPGTGYPERAIQPAG